jgi:hypothetical protein
MLKLEGLRLMTELKKAKPNGYSMEQVRKILWSAIPEEKEDRVDAEKNENHFMGSMSTVQEFVLTSADKARALKEALEATGGLTVGDGKGAEIRWKATNINYEEKHGREAAEPGLVEKMVTAIQQAQEEINEVNRKLSSQSRERLGTPRKKGTVGKVADEDKATPKQKRRQKAAWLFN